MNPCGETLWEARHAAETPVMRPTSKAVLDSPRGFEDKCQDDETDLQVNELLVRRGFNTTTQ